MITRWCDCGGCLETAKMIATFTDHLGQRQTRGACNLVHAAIQEVQLAHEGHQIGPWVVREDPETGGSALVVTP